MNTNEVFMGERYEELDGLHPGLSRGHLTFEALRDDIEGFRIIASMVPLPATPLIQLIIRFDNPLAYRNCDEGKRLRTMAGGSIASGIYRLHHSSLAAWLREECGYTDASADTYAVVTTDDWIEVVGGPPVLDWQL